MATTIANDTGKPLYPTNTGTNVVDEDTNFIAGDSPHIIDVNSGLGGVNGNRGYIAVDGTGDLLVRLSHKDTTFMTQFTLKGTGGVVGVKGEVFDLTGWDIDQIRLAHSGTNTAYRVQVW